MTHAELIERQSWSLEQKIDHSLGVIESFVNTLGGIDKVYLAFSGGKDSTVLSHLARMLYPDMLHVFINTGNEWPEILKFVAECERNGMNLVRVRPKLTPREVWAKYGFPLVSKEAANQIHTIKGNPEAKSSKKFLAEENPYHLSYKYRYLIDQVYDVDNECCQVLKKNPAHNFAKQSGRCAIMGMMASESRLRQQTYVRRGGCNNYTEKIPTSLPLSIWLEKDIYDAIEYFGLSIAEIYHKGATRTGCVGCGFGCQFKDDNRFQFLYDLHPKYYKMIMDYQNNGVSFREALRELFSRTNSHHLPDEDPDNNK